MSDESILGYVKRRLREEGTENWPTIATEAGKPISVLRKIAYGDKKNPRIDTIEPIAVTLRSRETTPGAAAPGR